jgi:hypothetical protein
MKRPADSDDDEDSDDDNMDQYGTIKAGPKASAATIAVVAAAAAAAHKEPSSASSTSSTVTHSTAARESSSNHGSSGAAASSFHRDARPGSTSNPLADTLETSIVPAIQRLSREAPSENGRFAMEQLIAAFRNVEREFPAFADSFMSSLQSSPKGDKNAKNTGKADGFGDHPVAEALHERWIERAKQSAPTPTK